MGGGALAIVAALVIGSVHHLAQTKASAAVRSFRRVECDFIILRGDCCEALFTNRVEHPAWISPMYKVRVGRF